jgi:hypothetical protein
MTTPLLEVAPTVARTERSLGVLMSGRRVSLERLSRRHIPALYEIATADGVADGWPLRGRMVDAPELEDYLWRQARVQFAIVRRDGGELVGLVQGVSDDPRSGTIDVAVVLAPRLWRAGWPLEAVLLFAGYLFDGLGYRKLYFSTPASVRARLGRSLDAVLSLECTFTRHVRSGDGYEDLSIFALHRDRWDTPQVRKIRSI